MNITHVHDRCSLPLGGCTAVAACDASGPPTRSAVCAYNHTLFTMFLGSYSSIFPEGSQPFEQTLHLYLSRMFSGP